MISGSMNILITGANQGIGFETAKHLARRGNNITIACRNMDAANKAVGEIKDEAIKNNEISCVELNLCSLESVKKCADTLIASKKTFDVVILNAGTMLPKERYTLDGIETTFQVNFVSQYFLFELLKKDNTVLAKPVRVICLTSLLHKYCGLFFSLPKTSSEWFSFIKKKNYGNDLLSDKLENTQSSRYKSWNYYAVSKAATAMLAYNLNNNDNIFAISVHPGCVRTSMTTNFAKKVPKYLNFLRKFLITPEQASLNVASAIDKTFTINYIKNKPIYQDAENAANLKKTFRSVKTFNCLKIATDEILNSYF
ncbi:Short-chain dehydrogenase/reductase SDR family and Glucose/ribitol dehydrogenase family and NAD(P)-binding domain-containing protein [Strongyloides ratti]|uniref:Short-chain dehydrogenase/reductase SDR family and Glucose/ribitol dehydrogenase family and NAD(P)-binding domain-containing protein n=1 Tax=Strongyloides ratti TaxID=34506 RepID=A0A090KP76_STRRB|nr:Short-chain dehydrogenase/reductase SDR family and Glucose/ribitol dehydrogenase family and NAD(P)-binding domain-containing protein [Strongyloides ratti]CEF59403.1 Short-chain dehydrogenase/reductase SDR family and Glucose/ribitol dehydrogenase family and NAD(P)-binding domain-containing protein [Strongyloides ratti]